MLFCRVLERVADRLLLLLLCTPFVVGVESLDLDLAWDAAVLESALFFFAMCLDEEDTEELAGEVTDEEDS